MSKKIVSHFLTGLASLVVVGVSLHFLRAEYVFLESYLLGVAHAPLAKLTKDKFLKRMKE